MANHSECSSVFLYALTFVKSREVTRSVGKLDWLVEVHIVKLNLPYLTSPYKYYILIRRFSERAKGKNKCGEKKREIICINYINK